VRRPAFFAKANDEECRDFCERNPCVWLDGRTAQCLRDAESERPESYCGRHALFLEKQCAHCHGEDGTGGVNLTRRVLDAKGVFLSPTGARRTASHAGMARGVERSGDLAGDSLRSVDQPTSALASCLSTRTATRRIFLISWPNRIFVLLRHKCFP
jgi:hypothetical protein